MHVCDLLSHQFSVDGDGWLSLLFVLLLVQSVEYIKVLVSG